MKRGKGRFVAIMGMALIVVACLTAWTLPLAAAPAPAEPQDGGCGDNGSGLTTVEVINTLDAYALVQAENALELKDGQYGEFASRLKRLQETRRRNLIARNRMVHGAAGDDGTPGENGRRRAASGAAQGLERRKSTC